MWNLTWWAISPITNPSGGVTLVNAGNFNTKHQALKESIKYNVYHCQIFNIVTHDIYDHYNEEFKDNPMNQGIYIKKDNEWQSKKN